MAAVLASLFGKLRWESKTKDFREECADRSQLYEIRLKSLALQSQARLVGRGSALIYWDSAWRQLRLEGRESWQLSTYC